MPEDEAVHLVNDPQTWTMVGVFATLIVGMLSIVTVLSTRAINAAGQAASAATQAGFSRLDAKVDSGLAGLQGKITARINAFEDKLTVRIDAVR